MPDVRNAVDEIRIARSIRIANLPRRILLDLPKEVGSLIVRDVNGCDRSLPGTLAFVANIEEANACPQVLKTLHS
jgi:hypothetical protein